MGRAWVVVQVHDEPMNAGPAIVIDPAAKDLQRLQAKMRAYVLATGSSAEGLISKKLTDVSLRLFRLYRIHRSGRTKTTKVWNQFVERTRQGRGVLVRTTGLSARRVNKNGAPLSNWQRRVARENNMRSSGSGYLSSQFLIAGRKRGGALKRGPQHRVMFNKSHDTASKLYKDETQGVLQMRVPGTERMNMRYGMISTALRQVTADIELYLRYKQGLIAKDTMRKQSGSARRASEKAYRHSIRNG